MPGGGRGRPGPAGTLDRQLAARSAAAGAGVAHESVRTARGLFRGPLTRTAAALTAGEIAPAHARVLAQGTRQLPDQVAADAEPVLLEAARRLAPPRLRQAAGYLLAVADPEGAARDHQRRHQRRGLWLTATLDNLVAVDELREAEAGQTVLAALEPLARPADADDPAVAASGPLMPWSSCAAGPWRGAAARGWWVRPQLLVTVDLDSLAGSPAGVGGDLGGAAGPGGVSAAGLGRDTHPGPGHPPPQRPRPRQRPRPQRQPAGHRRPQRRGGDQ